MNDEEIKIQGDLDIEEALKDFEIKSSQNEKEKRADDPATSENSKMVDFVIKSSGGLIKEGRTAEYFLLGFVILAIAISIFLFINAIRSPSPAPEDQIIDVAGPQGL